jgi:4-amino-4-deoxy-L-arabinose transferase-like glycosyltransferase
MARRAWSTARVALWLVLSAALGLRLWGIWFGLPFVHARPDELLVITTVYRFFTDGLNPKFFHYPTLYLYILGAVFLLFYAWGRLAGWFTSATHFVHGAHDLWQVPFVLARATAALFGTATVYVVYRLGVVLFDRATALAGATFLAFAFLHVRDSHYATTDAGLVFFITCAVLALAHLHTDRRLSFAVLAGIFGGLATSTKYNAAVLAAPMIAVEVLYAWRVGPMRALRSTYLPLMAVLSAAVFFATSPYLLIDHPEALKQLRELSGQAAVGMTPPELLGSGWTYHLRFSLPHGLGLPLFGASLAGFALLAVRRPDLALLLGAFPLAYYLAAGAGYNVFVRYMLPVVPFLCLFAGYLVREVARVAARRVRLREPVVVGALAVAIVAPTAWSSLQFVRILGREDNRVIAARWIQEHVPPGSSIYVTGNAYGHPPIETRPPTYRLFVYDYRARTFVYDGRHTGEWPEWIVMQRSRLPYSHVPADVVEVRDREYVLMQTFRALDLDEERNVYDIQDAFYLPYGSFHGVRRPGPNFEIYRRQER